MEKIRIGKKERLYEIRNIRPTSANVMEIIFAGTIPVTYGDITIYTEDGTEATTLHGYDTVWKQDGNTVWLSNDGSVYTPLAPPEPVERQNHMCRHWQRYRLLRKPRCQRTANRLYTMA